jgi:hypothetical protein
MRVLRPVLVLLAAAALACAAPGASRPFPPPPAGADDAAAREVLGRFARALEAGRLEEAHALLSARWRQAYTSGQLALDFRGAGPWGRETAARVLARLDAGEPLVRGPDAAARLPIGEGRTAVAVLEPGGWRVDALEEASAGRSRR